jgi:hypothetical protein
LLLLIFVVVDTKSSYPTRLSSWLLRPCSLSADPWVFSPFQIVPWRINFVGCTANRFSFLFFSFLIFIWYLTCPLSLFSRHATCKACILILRRPRESPRGPHALPEMQKNPVRDVSSFPFPQFLHFSLCSPVLASPPSKPSGKWGSWSTSCRPTTRRSLGVCVLCWGLHLRVCGEMHWSKLIPSRSQGYSPLFFFLPFFRERLGGLAFRARSKFVEELGPIKHVERWGDWIYVQYMRTHVTPSSLCNPQVSCPI